MTSWLDRTVCIGIPSMPAKRPSAGNWHKSKHLYENTHPYIDVDGHFILFFIFLTVPKAVRCFSSRTKRFPRHQSPDRGRSSPYTDLSELQNGSGRNLRRHIGIFCGDPLGRRHQFRAHGAGKGYEDLHMRRFRARIPLRISSSKACPGPAAL